MRGGAGMARRAVPSTVVRVIVWATLSLLLAWACVVAYLMTSAGGQQSGGGIGPWRMPVYLNPFGGRRTAAQAVVPPVSGCDDQSWKRQTLGQERAWPPESTIQCAMWGTWTEACYYENVCFDAHERALLFWKDEKSPDTGIGPLGARDWAANAAAAAGAEGAEDPYDRDPSYAYPVYSPLRWHVSHNDLLTGQVLPLSQFPRHGASRPKLFPFNSNMKGRFMTDEEAQIHWRRTAAEWDAQRHGRPPPFVAEAVADAAAAAAGDASGGAGAGPIEEMPVEEAIRLVYGSDDNGSGGLLAAAGGSWWAAALGVSASSGGLLPAEDTAVILSNKVQLQNIWYYSSRVTPWFEAVRLNGSGMLPFLLPQPAVAFLHTSENLVGSDWHRSFLALAMGLPKHVLFPHLYGPPPTPSNTGTPRPSPKKGTKPSRSPSPLPPYPEVVELPNGARYWAGQRVPRILYKLVPPKASPQPGVAQPLEDDSADSGPDIIVDAATSEGSAASDAEAAAASSGDGEAGSGSAQGARTDSETMAHAGARSLLSSGQAVAAGAARLEEWTGAGGRVLLYKSKPEPSAGAAKPNAAGGYIGAVAGSWVVTSDDDIREAEAAAARLSPRPPSSRRPKPSPEPSPARRLPGSPIDPNADEERTRCFRKLVLTGASGFVFGDTYSGSEFRARALASIGRNDQPKFLGPGMPSFFGKHLPPRRVLLIDRRRGKPRHIVNSDAIKALLDAYEVPYTHLVDFRGTFEQQVAYYNDHGILLGVHGAGFINCMFMRQGSAVIEVFPYHVKHTLYQRQAYAAGLTHFSVYATDPTGLFKRGNALFAYLRTGCEKWPSVMTQWKDNACRGPLIGAQLTAPMRSLEEALVNALDMIGSRTEYLGLYNDVPISTVADKPSLEDMLGDFAPSPKPSKLPAGAIPGATKSNNGALRKVTLAPLASRAAASRMPPSRAGLRVTVAAASRATSSAAVAPSKSRAASRLATAAKAVASKGTSAARRVSASSGTQKSRASAVAATAKIVKVPVAKAAALRSAASASRPAPATPSTSMTAVTVENIGANDDTAKVSAEEVAGDDAAGEPHTEAERLNDGESQHEPGDVAAAALVADPAEQAPNDAGTEADLQSSDGANGVDGLPQ